MTPSSPQHNFPVPAPAHQRTAMPLHMAIIIFNGIIALGSIAGGAYAVFLGASGTTELTLLGSQLTTSNVGVAFIGIGLLVALFTVRSVLKNQRDLAALPADKRTSSGS